MALSYSPFTAILQHLSFVKRKHLVSICPSIRKHEENYPYHLDVLNIDGSEKTIRIDSLLIRFGKSAEGTTKCQMSIGTQRKVRVPIPNCSETDAAEKFALYHLSRAGTTIKDMRFQDSPTYILKCTPLRIRNLRIFCCWSSAPEGFASWVPTLMSVQYLETNSIIEDDTISNARRVIVDDGLITLNIVSIDMPPILIEWNCYQLEVALSFNLQGIVDYCREMAKRSRPIGSSFTSIIKHQNVECSTLDWFAAKAGGRKTWWNGRKCATITIDETTELNLHGDEEMFSEKLVIEVNAKGTAKDR